MAFTRTNAGLNNQHQFHNVDFIVFVEGGESLSIQEINDGIFNEKSIDIIFWEKIFNRYKPSNVKFKAIGSKTAIKKIAESIVSSNLTTIYAAMDQEFDMVLNTNIIHPNVLYTHGYSWENDVWSEKVIEEIVKFLSAELTDCNILQGLFDKFLTDVKFSVYADGHLFTKNNSFFPRPNGHMKIIECNITLQPLVKKAEIKKLIQNHNIKLSTVYSFASRKNLDIRRNCYGHLFGDFCKNLIKYMLRALHNLNGISDEFIRRTAISFFPNFISADIDNHYKQAFS